jgi:tetratricopeptide (TPR) repeat protein
MASCDPVDATAANLARAVELHCAGHFAQAAAAYARIPGEHPRASSVLYLRAGAMLRAEGLASARPLVQRAAGLEGTLVAEDADAPTYLAIAERLRTAGRLGEAVPCYEIALSLDDALVGAHLGLGLVYAALSRALEAAACFQSALRIDAGCVPALLNLGTAWRHLGQRESALPCYRLAVKLAPDQVEGHYLLGTLLCELRDLDEAVAVHRRALALAPDHAAVLTDLGSALVLQGDTEEGPSLLRRAVELAPRWPVAQVNLGIALVRERRFREALVAFRAAQEADPDFVYARFCESNLYLMQGDFEQGYGLYDAHRSVYPHRHRERRWDGKALSGRTILLYAQHGLGDTLQFVRYVPHVAAAGGKVVLQVQRGLVPFLARQRGAAVVCPTDQDPGPFDVQATLLELPAILGDTLATIPAEVPYVHADPALRVRWAAHLSCHGGFKVGIAWHGNPHQKDGLIRRCSLLDMAPIWDVPGVAVYSLQKGAGCDELTAAAGTLPVRDFGEIDKDAGAFMDTAAIMESLDLVVTIDTSIAHLAGGLARPVWMVVPYWADWRWMIERTDSPWYPTMRIFRQPRPGAWGPVFDELAAALHERVRKGRAA